MNFSLPRWHLQRRAVPHFPGPLNVIPALHAINSVMPRTRTNGFKELAAPCADGGHASMRRGAGFLWHAGGGGGRQADGGTINTRYGLLSLSLIL